MFGVTNSTVNCVIGLCNLIRIKDTTDDITLIKDPVEVVMEKIWCPDGGHVKRKTSRNSQPREID